MDPTKKEHRPFLFPGQEVHWRAPQATQDAEGDHFQVQPRRRNIQTTDVSVSRAVSLSQASSSQIMNNNFYSSPANDPVPGVVYPQRQNVSAPAYRLHDDTGYYDVDLYPGVYHDRNNFLPAQPQADHYASQMDIIPSRNGGFPANSWPQYYDTPRDCRPLATYVADLHANAASEPLSIPEGVSWDPAYSELALQGDQRQGSAVPPLRRVSEDLSPHEAPTHFAPGFEQGHLHTVGIQNQPGSWPSTSKLVSYPNMGYEKVFDNHRHAANSRVIGVAAEVEDPINRQHKPMLNYRRMPSTSLLPLPSPSSPHAEPNKVANRVAFETSSDVSLEFQQDVWDVVTGKSVPVKRKRSPSNEERADSQAIRNSGGQCKRCKDGKRKVCAFDCRPATTSRHPTETSSSAKFRISDPDQRPAPHRLPQGLVRTRRPPSSRSRQTTSDARPHFSNLPLRHVVRVPSTS